MTFDLCFVMIFFFNCKRLSSFVLPFKFSSKCLSFLAVLQCLSYRDNLGPFNRSLTIKTIIAYSRIAF